MVAFHSQQCIEKSLKAVIEEYEIGSVRIHNLERLFEIVGEQLKLDVAPVLVAMLDKLYMGPSYAAGSITTRSFASSAAYAILARRASLERDG